MTVIKNNQRFHLALVTGASSGIGKALCELLADQGIDLILTGRNRKTLEELREELAHKVHVQIITADLTDPQQRFEVIESIRDQQPDLIINNAGMGLYGEAINHPTEEQMKIVELNINAVTEIALEGAKALFNSGKKGAILNVSSIAADYIFPYLAVYAATKAYVNSFSIALDEEIRGQGIRILTSCPGPVETQFRERAGGKAKGSSGSMTPEYAAERIWQQIQSGKQIVRFSWRYVFLTALTRLLPRRTLYRALKASIARLKID